MVPDHRGMATGMAIMGFGGGAFIGGYLNPRLTARVGVAVTVMILGALYFVVMMIGARIIRRPPADYRPVGWTAPAQMSPMIAHSSVNRNQALRTRQFYLLWGVLFINVTAGIGILAQASPMMQDMFRKTALEAGGVISIISLFNAGGRFFSGRSQWVLLEVMLFVIFTMYCGGFATIPAFLADIFGRRNVGASTERA